MNPETISLFILLISCSYPDIDTVPSFNNMKISIQDSIDICKLVKTPNEDFSECFIELIQITNRL